MTSIDASNLAEIGWMLAPLRREPSPEAPLDTEAVRGETVALGAEEEGWVQARLLTDGYEGYLPAAALATLGPVHSHVVAVPRTLAFPAPDFKRPPIAALTMGARVRIVRHDGRYAVSEYEEHLIADHLAPVDSFAQDLVTVAEGFLGTPYLWGGKSALGLDCSGLVQLAAARCGIRLPRDSGPQEREAGAALAADGAAEFARGDLLFWKGHVAIARGDGTILHANAHHMLVAVEDARAAIERIAGKGDPLRAVRRLPSSA